MRYAVAHSCSRTCDIIMQKQAENNENNTVTNVDTASATTTDTSTSATTAPEAAINYFLILELKNTTKDYPGVAATVDNGEVTLTGTITKKKLPKLMQSVQALNPKKVNNN